jgi:hypothetical protein
MDVFTRDQRAAGKSDRLNLSDPSSQNHRPQGQQPAFNPVLPLLFIGAIVVGSIFIVQAQGGWHQIYISPRLALDMEDLGSAQAGPASMRLDGWMMTTFRFWFSAPTPLPAGTPLPQSLGFISFDEMNAFAAVDATQSSPGSWGLAEAKVWALTGNSAWAKVPKTYSPNYAESADPSEGYRRGTVVASVNIASGYGDYMFPFAGFVFADPTGPGAFARVIAGTGVVVSSTPDPLGVPEVGDNEYVWLELYPPIGFPPDPVGAILFVPSRATVVGGDGGTLEYFRPQLDWLVSNPGLPPAQRAENGSDGASHAIYAVSSIINPYHSFPNNLEIWNGLLFGGYGAYLPANNSDFGRKGVTMTFGGGNVHTANIEVFYPATGKRHPSGGPPAWGGSTPNFIYYYAQIYPSNDVYYYPFGGSHYNLGENVVWITSDAADPYPVRLFEMGTDGFITHDKGVGEEGFARDRLFVRGIHAYIYIVEHEPGHRNDYNTFHNGQRVLDTTGRPGDADQDGLLDAWEELHGFDPARKDTADAYPGDPTPGDQQASADIQAYGALVNTKELWRQDWAYWWGDLDNCMQYGNPYGQWRPFKEIYDPTLGRLVPLQRLKPIP